MLTCIYQSPVGILKISETDGKITGVCLWREKETENSKNCAKDSCNIQNTMSPCSELLSLVCAQLDEYFAGKRKQFDVPIRYSGTPFQESVWNALRSIPYGETRSYEDIAISAGSPKAVRAVGQANHDNPLMILVPCHRVIRKNGDIGGFAGGTEVKKYLLSLEAGNAALS